jgi:hypothetical protein
MTEQTQPYVEHHPGDLIAAETLNQVQIDIRNDIAQQIAAAKDDIRHTGVDKAGDSAKFGGATQTDFVQSLDDRYAPKVHSHEGQTAYRRYIKEFDFDAGVTRVLLQHNLGAYPLVDVYELLPVGGTATATGGKPCKLFFYYGAKDAEQFNLLIRVGKDRARLGVGFEELLRELGVAYHADTVLEDVLNDMQEKLWADPNDELPFCTSPWVDECCGERRSVEDLKRGGQWDDLRVALRPRKCGKGADPSDGGAPVCQVDVTQINYQTLQIEALGLTTAKVLDLMILLRL